MTSYAITAIYNEAFLLPFYLKHYAWVDRLHIVYDTTSTDDSLTILQADPRVVLHPITSPEGINDRLKIDTINALYHTLPPEGLVLCVDVDEYVHQDRAHLETVMRDHESAFVAFYDVYRHVSEGELDLNLTIWEQRRHGFLRDHYTKPILVRTGLPDVYWEPGNHWLFHTKTASCGLTGSHWKYADPCFVFQRQLEGRAKRLSPTNYAYGYGTNYADRTVEKVALELIEHAADPLLW